MLDREALSELQAIATCGAEAARSSGRESELREVYDALRARATTLAHTAIAQERGMAARVRQRLVELSAWAAGVRLAYETLERDAGGDA